MKLALGINCYQYKTYNRMLKLLHPVVETMLDEMCEEAKEEKKNMPESTLGSWKQAVTCADGV